MKFLVDNQLPPALARFINEDLATSAIHVQDVDLAVASDRDIWAYTTANDLILVTKDEDFVTVYSTQPTASLLWVRLRNCRKIELLQTFERTWPKIFERFKDGERFVELR